MKEKFQQKTTLKSYGLLVCFKGHVFEYLHLCLSLKFLSTAPLNFFLCVDSLF